MGGGNGVCVGGGWRVEVEGEVAEIGWEGLLTYLLTSLLTYLPAYSPTCLPAWMVGFGKLVTRAPMIE